MSFMSSPSWPKHPDEQVYHGPAGAIIQDLAPHTEADPVALLVQLLVAFGAAIGRGPYVVCDGAKHFTNEYAVIVGKTSRSRKGTSWAHVRNIIIPATGGQP